MEKIKLITCRRYEARLMPRSCGFRYREALALAKRPRWGGRATHKLRKVELCLDCPTGRRHMPEAVPCKARGCYRPPGKDGLCVEHSSKGRAAARREAESGLLV